MCELLAIDKSSSGPETFFLVGLLSVLDSIIGTPMADIVQQLPLTAVIKAALLKREGEPGQVLESVLAYEAGDWISLQDCGADTDSLHRAYWRSIEFASDTMRSLTSLRI
jgi:EAL and modified HD-GYP domain-containing signal transduction protein